MSKKIAPKLSMLAKAGWNFMDSPDSGDLVGGEYARAESATWDAATVELRALLAVARAARSAVNFWREEYDIEPPTPQDQALDRALSRLDRLSSGTGKRKARGPRSPEGTETP